MPTQTFEITRWEVREMSNYRSWRTEEEDTRNARIAAAARWYVECFIFYFSETRDRECADNEIEATYGRSQGELLSVVMGADFEIAVEGK